MLAAGVISASAVSVAATADDVSNNLDASLDAVAETMAVNVGGANGTTGLYIVERNSDGKNGCNLTGSTTLTLNIGSNNPAVATVSPSSVTFTACNQTKTLTVTPVAQGSATITATQASNTTGGSFNLAPATFTVNVAAPVVTNAAPSVSVAGVTGGASYPKGAVPSATCEVLDAEDGPSSFPATLSGTLDADGLGSQTAACSYTDGGGLKASSSKTYSILDPSSPGIAYDLTPPDGENGWWIGNVSLDWKVTENESPSSLQLAGCVDQSITQDQAATTYTCDASSSGGIAPQSSVVIKRDGTQPFTGCTGGSSGWVASNVTLDCTAEDATSGLADTNDARFSLSTSVADGAHDGSAETNSKTVKDVAGNSKTESGGSFMVDRRDPTIGFDNCPSSTVLVGSGGMLDWTASDNGGSGIAAATGSLSRPTAPGLNEVSTDAPVDQVGNTGVAATCSYRAVYDYSGFFAPIDNPSTGKINAVKAGSGVPIKFSLGGNQGLNVFAAGSPASRTINCDGTDTVSTDTPIATAGSSSLQYDAATGVYTYVWKTDKAWAGQCRKLTVTFNDGTSRTVDFKAMK